MSVLSDINISLGKLGIPLETGVFTENAPDKYIVVVPLTDTFGVNADNTPIYDVQEDKNRIVRLLISEDFTITGRQYIGYETETGYHHYVVDVAKHYDMEE